MDTDLLRKIREGIAGTIWKPIEGFIDVVVHRLVKRAAAADRSLEEYIVGHMLSREARDVTCESNSKFKTIKEFTRENSAYCGDLDIRLAQIDADAGPRLNEPDVCRRKAKTIYMYLWAIPSFDKRLSTELRSQGRNLDLSALLARYAWRSASIRLDYLIWRVEKEHNSAADVSRAQEGLREFIRDETPPRGAYTELSRVLRSPKLPAERVDMILDLFLENRHRDDLAEEVRGHLVNGEVPSSYVNAALQEKRLQCHIGFGTFVHMEFAHTRLPWGGSVAVGWCAIGGVSALSPPRSSRR